MRYTPLELDKMRSAIHDAETDRHNGSCPRPDDVERRLLTYMANGTTVEELNQYAQHCQREREERDETARREQRQREDQCGEHDYALVEGRYYVQCRKCWKVRIPNDDENAPQQ